MKHLKFVVSAGLALLPVAGAQSAAPSGQNARPQPTPEMRARMAQMKPVMDLADTVRLLPELEKNRATAVTRAQARQLLGILTRLQGAQAVQPNDAKRDLAQIEDKLLTERQLTALGDLTLRAEQEREARRAQGQGGPGQRPGGLRLPGVPGAVGGQQPGAGTQRPSGQGPQAGPFNPFKGGRGADELKQYIAVLQRK